ncbi:PPOX class F420-dependent oxidoreductase [Streptomyces acidiscabies]|uniref:PPOX class F420-dependent oxidoreductase n=1 Tax=Streptomyces acidiscabies TaxID=42234 RepID=A0AAP6BBL2_9ACTN|nr:PPOX class F420-dependent oxidoreductase [Streptomyces acidiscabies]MBP5942466.1 PPOX class F420-dependent oxidoreductase [Streptomyces sp. LBUM 1476]MBZ3917783.1 PPOX class F420-dependent oxidoreductase [Streptomyces acidiscabies]MDX2961753.1 PPOX class F420-dependent oxidoreductase [Streptomyces acidiscabies]MDX3023500.1 PPOX class F420-dependent oxidoreductase [Streptomyces acidiscabies]MDX3789294.1 PPOX class F420-dependent oxidoreductase [Streptomyces acidiscabies]
MLRMTEQEWRAFAMYGTRTGKLSTARADGSPHVTPVWFLLDGDDIVFTTEKNGVKGRNLARDGRFALCVDEDRPPYAFVLLQGRAEISEDPDDMLRWGGLLGVRYMDENRAEEYAARNGGPGNLLVRGRIDKVIAFAGIAD